MKRKYNSILKAFTYVLFVVFFSFFTENIFAQSCNCVEYLYLNENSNGGKVHKYAINTDGTLTEIFNAGNAWYPGAATSELGNPHGLGTDLNGHLYIAGSYDTQEIRRLDCDGNITPATEYAISNVTTPHFNFMSIDNTIYTNVGEVYDICTGQMTGSVQLCGLTSYASMWGFYYDPQTEYFYINGSDNGESHLWRYTIDDYNSGQCVPIFVQDTYIESNIPDYNVMRTRGITTDPDGNIYMYLADWDDAGTTNEAYALVKFDANGNFLGYVEDTANDGTGFFLGTGLVYSETSGLLYGSTMSTIDDCVATFDTDLNYLGAAVGPSGDTGQGQIDFDRAKGIAIMSECCPDPVTQTIDQVYCVTGANEELFLNELFPCDGIICGATWTPSDALATAVYDDCAQSVVANAAPGCYSFTKSGSNTQCGNFQLNFNLEILEAPEITMSGDQTICGGSVPSALSVSTTATNIQWQMSTTSCTDGFTDIDGATSGIYTPEALTETTYYRAIITGTASCSAGSCAFESPCITVNVQPNEARVYALAASCTNGIPNNDGYFQISSLEGSTHYNYVMGSDYSTGDPDINNATAIDPNALPLQFGTLPNPTGSQDYTFRIFNADNGCFRDYTVTLEEQDCTTTCACDEYIYLNEPWVNATLKFRVNPDGSLTEILSPSGGHWAENLTIAPHGLGSDLNGFLYIGNHDALEPAEAGVDRYDCDGNLVQEDYIPAATGSGTDGVSGHATNIYSIGNTIYMNNWVRTAYPKEPMVFAYDICTQELLGSYSICDSIGKYNWDFVVDETTNQIIMNTSIGVAIGDLDANLNGACIPFTFIKDTTLSITSRGIVVDEQGNIYVRGNDDLRKYDSAGNLQCSVDLTISGGGNAWGMVYSEETGNLYLAGNDADCISVYDTNCNYIMQGVANNANASTKAIASVKECCPTPNRQSVNQTFCVAGSNEQLFLNELFPCDGIVCEGQWVAADPASAAIYNDCDQSIAENIGVGCYKFTKGSDGLENYPKCGAFELEFNLEILAEPAITVSANQTICNGAVPAALSVTTASTDIQWQMSTTSCTDGFTDIDGATSATYTPSQLTTTTYYRAIVTETATCSNGNCAFESDCITITIDPTCVPYDVSLDKTVDPVQAPIGSNVVFTITVYNEGDAVTGATVTDVLPNGSIYITDDANGAYSSSTGIWTIGDMAAGDSAKLNLTVQLSEPGVLTNSASVTINETETDTTNNDDKACVTVPVELCDDGSQTMTAVANPGFTTYQWYVDIGDGNGYMPIDGATQETLSIDTAGSYIYTVEDAELGSCGNQMCCPIIVDLVACVECPPKLCIPISVTKR